MTEKEKMIKNLPYLSADEILVKERFYAKKILFEFNNLPPDEFMKGIELLKGFLGKTGERFWIEQTFKCDYGYNISIGENFYANYNCVILDVAPVIIGNNVMFAPNVGIYTAGHPVHHEPRNAGIEYGITITIGDNVWIGGDVTINPGVHIGSNTVIGSGSIVTKDIPSHVIAVGNPCKVIRQITDTDKQYYFKNLKLSNI